MDQKEYDKVKKEIETLLVERGCFVYNIEKDEFLEGIFPVAIDFLNYDEQEQLEIIMVSGCCDIDLNAPLWTDNIGKAFKINDLLGLHYIVNTLIWEDILPNCTFLIGDDSDYDTLFSIPRDGDFIDKLLEEYMW